MNTVGTQDLFQASEPELLQLPDANLAFWRQIDLHQPHDQLLQELITSIVWRQQKITVYGKTYLQPRLSAWYGDVSYRYSGIRLDPLPWTDCLRQLNRRIETITGLTFNSVLLNYYRDHNDSMGMHSDDERELGDQPAIASLSLGATRALLFKHKTRKDLKTFKLPLTAASLLTMQDHTQKHWRHGINKIGQCCGPRINLTFRLLISSPQA